MNKFTWHIVWLVFRFVRADKETWVRFMEWSALENRPGMDGVFSEIIEHANTKHK